jgi:hypothetical protein
MRKTLLKIATEFGLMEDAKGAIPGVPTISADHEKEVIDKLDRSVKFDEIDTVTFGLETDDNKIVKVYVNAEESEEFEKALSTKLGEVDDIEQVLQELSKDFDIVDVEWPTEDAAAGDDEVTDDGSEVMDKKVFKKKETKTEKETGEEEAFEGLSFGENATLQILDESNSSTSIESRFTTAAQLMVYHAIIDLGVPEVALARNAYRAAIIKGIRERASELQQNASMKQALKTFIKRAINFDEKAKENGDRGREEMKTHIAHRAGDDKIKKEEVVAPMSKIQIQEDKVDWEFTMDKEDFTIACKSIRVTIDQEETEKVIKGLTNRDAVIVKDVDNDKKKVVFSPRGSNVLVKLVGSAEGYMMNSKDVDELLDTISPETEKAGEEVTEAQDETECSDEAFEKIKAAGGKNVTTTSNAINYYDKKGVKKQIPHKMVAGGKRVVNKSDLNTHLSELDPKAVKEALKATRPEPSNYRYDKNKSFMDNLDAFAGREIKVGRNIIHGQPVDIEDSDGTYIDVTAVDKDACTILMKKLRSAGFKVKRDGDIGFSVDE